MKPETAATGRGWYRDYRLQAAALGLIMAGFIAVFW
jgi:hypothetical protein